MKTVNRVSFNKETMRTRCVCSYNFLFWIAFVVSFTSALAQNKLETDQGLADAVASYDADIRHSILIASQHPAILVQLQKSQDETMASFQKMIGNFRQKKQEWFYTITRYPDLMHQLANLSAGKSQEEIYKLLPTQEPALKQAAWKLYRNERKNLARLDNIRLNASNEFDKSVAHLSPSAREAFHKLQGRPDVLTLLTNNIDLTTKLGERYKANSGEVTDQLAVLHDKLEIQNQREAAAFKKQLESNPKAMKELRQASTAYGNNSYYSNPYYYPYSYWFGYPYWYSYAMWYPGMYWYYPGFYFGAGGLYGFPSYGFSYWFYNGGYYTTYPHLYRALGGYYQNNVTTTHLTAPINRGFANVATTHYDPMTSRATSLSSPYSYRQQGSLQQQSHNFNGNVNAPIYRSQSFGGFGRSGLIGGGTMGGGFHGGGRGRH